MSIAALYTLGVARKISPLLKLELPSVFVSLVLWAVGIGVLFHQTDLVQGDAGIVDNANLYYFRYVSVR